MPPRVRFAPSPTGYLHVGGARTALFNWLFARKSGGTFVLRIEDTDRERSTEAHTQDAERLLAEGKAYRCFCTREELDERRAQAGAAGSSFRYDRRCWRLSAEEVRTRLDRALPFTIRFFVPDEQVAWDDAVHGPISVHSQELDDFVILRSDRSAIYNLAVVSDDITMRITHVIRGDGHVSNTPKQILLYRALGHAPPVFAHVPMILGPDGKKLSKRHGATAVGDYRDQGIFPAALRNFLALLGWSPGGDREIIPEPELIQLFSLEGIQSKPAVFDAAKLEWMNGQYLSMTAADELLEPVRRQLARLGVSDAGRDLRPIINVVKARSRTILQLAEQVATRVDPGRVQFDAKGEQLVRKMGPQFRHSLELARTTLNGIAAEQWSAEHLLERLKSVAEQNGLKLGDLLQPVRVVLTGSTVSEPVNELLAVVGRERSIGRLTNYLHDAAA